MASKSNKGAILAKFFDDGQYTTLFADGAVSAASGYAAGQQAYAVYQNGEAVAVKDVERNIKVLELWLHRLAARWSPSMTRWAQSWPRVWMC